ncbi:MAG TPA: DNA replication/repair protein RecF [Anaerolineales bacterium]|nr:DNA replication/repair protein RecF [Anaerolineales bacterium]
MHLSHLSLTNFRNFARLDLDLPPRTVLILGGNAQGKTSILEAIYFLASFASFQTHTDRQLINFVEARNPLAVTRLVGDYQRNGVKHRMEVRLVLEPTGTNGQRLRKEILLDGVKKQANDVIGHFNAVIFVPQMSQIIEGGPEERRGYLNLAISQAVPGYAGALSDYGQALAQRNALLKALGENGGDPHQLDVWDETLSRLGARIMSWRIAAVQQIERLAARIHHELSHGREILRIHYRPAYDPLPAPSGQIGMKLTTEVDRTSISTEEIQVGFLARLASLRAEEIARGMTVIGPHRDELRFLGNGIDLGEYGSRGQMRTTLLALKLAEVSWMKERTGEWPVTLLDEVMAELDVQRRQDLLRYVQEGEQVMLTATDAGMFASEFRENAEIWNVAEGAVQRGISPATQRAA